MSGRRRDEAAVFAAAVRHRPEYDQLVAVTRDWAAALDELDELGSLTPWRVGRLRRARQLLRRCAELQGLARRESARLEADA